MQGCQFIGNVYILCLGTLLCIHMRKQIQGGPEFMNQLLIDNSAKPVNQMT